MINQQLQEIILQYASSNKHFTFLIGAGLSAESNIPTFRGPEGYWTIESAHYHPQEMATKRMFNAHFNEVWKWYLYRINTCSVAKPNPGHYALVEIEQKLTDQFSLISQNVDGLNIRAGSSIKNYFPIHGDLTFMRCYNECSNKLHEIPTSLSNRNHKHSLSKEELALLKCPSCNSKTRPHVLWFDEYYNEEYYRLHSVLERAINTDILFTIGTSAATNLPNQVFDIAINNEITIVDININDNPFAERLSHYKKGHIIKEKSGSVLPKISSLIS